MLHVVKHLSCQTFWPLMFYFKKTFFITDSLICCEKSICFSTGLHNLICSFLSCSFMNNSSTPIASVLCVSPYACVCCMCGGNALSEEPLPQLRDLQLCCRASRYRCRWKSRGLCMCVCDLTLKICSCLEQSSSPLFECNQILTRTSYSNNEYKHNCAWQIA